MSDLLDWYDDPRHAGLLAEPGHESPRGLPPRLTRGLSGVLLRWLKVPDRPPALPAHSGDVVESFRPAPGYLSYKRFGLALGGMVALGGLGSAMVACAIDGEVELAIGLGFFLGLPLVVLFAVALAAVRFQYEVCWYVLGDRAMRLRRGIMTVRETTITFDNVQDVTVQQGPLQRWFGIADVIVKTAGGATAGPQGQDTGEHVGRFEGVADAGSVRDLVTSQVRSSPGAGLGDEPDRPGPVNGFGPSHVAVLREIRDLAARL